MLPLWIIDLREKSNRRDLFEGLVGQIDHVYIERTGNGSASEGSDQPAAVPEDINPGSDSFSPASIAGPETKVSIHDRLETKDRQEADKNSIIKGDYWRYSRMQDFFYGIGIGRDTKEKQSSYAPEHIRATVEDTPTPEGVAERLYRFQSDLVREGQAFIKQIRSTNAHPDAKVNVVVLGDLTEDFTRIVFPSIAGLLQKEKERILPHHIHQGMEIIGMLFIPSDINTHEVSIRRSMQRTLREIDVQHRVNDLRGYDHVMLYQDVQNRTECTYPILSDEQLAQYLMQCLVHLYFACNDSHPLLSGTASADVFYFSMGVASVYYDTENEDMKGRHKMAVEFVRNFLSDGIDEKERTPLSIIDEGDYAPGTFFDGNLVGRLDLGQVEEERPSPHPIRNFMAKYLKKYYYNLFLRFFAVNLLRRIINDIDNGTRSALEDISTKSKRRFTDAQRAISESLADILGKLSANDGGIPAIIRLFKEMQENFSARRNDIQRVLEQNFWRQTNETIDRRLADTFNEYHSAYEADVKNKTGGTHQLEMKKQAVTELNGILSDESTMLGRIGRSLLLGIMLALALVPVLNFLSPHFINLGHVRRNGEWWSLGLFFVPVLLQIISWWRYNRRKLRAMNNLKAMFLHDAYARVANRIDSEINSFYDKMIALADKYIARCESIRSEIGRDLKEEELEKPPFPRGMFNQPLIGGQFGDDHLLPEKEADDMEVKINYIRYKLNEVTETEYFLFINQNKNILKNLFADVALCENLIRRVKSNGEEELVTKEQQEREQQEAWIRHRKQFHSDLRAAIKDAVLPREDSTLGEKLYYFCTANTDQTAILRPMIAYAATNGEVTSSSDKEYADVKMNDKRVEDSILPYLPSPYNQTQYDKYDKVYGKYIFITRWRCFEHFSLNRILPTEDFDEKIRSQRVYEEEVKAKDEKKKKTAHRFMEEELIPKEHTEGQIYTPKVSSLLLWALCPDGSSSEWFRLFDSEFFAEAYADRDKYRKILNQND